MTQSRYRSNSYVPLIVALSIAAGSLIVGCNNPKPNPTPVPPPVIIPVPQPQPVPQPIPRIKFAKAPTRDQLSLVCMTFQGLNAHTKTFGIIPWFDGALGSTSLTIDDRKLIYADKKASIACNKLGDTHAIIGWDNYYGPIYSTGNTVYKRMVAPAFYDHPDQFIALAKETITAGFWLDVPQFEDYIHDGTFNNCPSPSPGHDWPADCHPRALKTWPKLYTTLKNTDVGDLNRYVVHRPGWDGVFYGWRNSDILAFGKMVKSTCPYCVLAIEFNTGHIPLGNGPSDWKPGGLMSQYYDILYVEFNDQNIHHGSTWQILGRLLGPAYKRPADQPKDDDPHPPFYLTAGTKVNCFEYGEYEFTHGSWGSAIIDTMRKYLYSVGCPVVN